MTAKTINILIYSFTLIGLTLDIIGVLKIFNLREHGLKGMNIYMEDDELRDNLFSNIRKTNDANTSIRNKSEMWIWLIILGFLLQAMSGVLGIYLSLR